MAIVEYCTPRGSKFMIYSCNQSVQYMLQMVGCSSKCFEDLRARRSNSDSLVQ